MSKQTLSLVWLSVVLGLSAPVFAETRIDPTRPPGQRVMNGPGAAQAKPSYVLTSVVIAPSRRRATINGILLQVSDEIDGAQVTAIEAGFVRLRKHGKEWTLNLLPIEFKHVAKGTQP